MRRTNLAMLATSLLLAAPALAQSTPRSQQLWTPDGAPVNCISLQSIRSTHVVDDRTINFVISNNRMFTNTLPRACAGLGMNRAFSHNSRTTQLCAVNSITVVQRGANRMAGPSCGLGQFQPMKPVPATPAATPPAG
ncbi:DUF6491 family protein [Polymorphobacter arshaanensis]|nr:DUF6491 family protein [Polymorphobacter arshaanensis]